VKALIPRRNLLVLSIVALSIPMLGCGMATTKVTSAPDPAFAHGYSKLVIYAPFADLESRTRAEDIFVARLKKRGVEGVPLYTVLPAGRDYVEDDYARAVGSVRADGLLMVVLTDSEMAQVYVPPTTQTTGQATKTPTGITYSGRTTQAGGYFIGKPLVYYRLELWDLSRNKMAWDATSRTPGNGVAGFDTLMESLAGTAIKKMRDDKVITDVR